MEKNFQYPPPKDTFWELFDYFWDNGIGNVFNKKEDPTAWTARTLSFALDQEPSETSIGSWRKRKHLPRQEQIQRMCRILFAHDHQMRKAWAEAFLAERRAEELNRKNTIEIQDVVAPAEADKASIKVEKKRSEKDAVLKTDLSQQKVDTIPTSDSKITESFLDVPQTGGDANLKRAKLALIVASIFLTLLSAHFFLSSSSSDTIVKKMIFCDPENFSDEKDVCENSITNFPTGTKMVMVSFRIDGATDGQRFERRWYRNGEKWKEKLDFYDNAWPGYTFIHNESGHDLGEYALRVIVDGITYTGRFTVGEIEAASDSAPADSSKIPVVENIRVCDKFRFNNDTKKCDQHISVFVHGIDDVYLSFDFKNVPENMAFERWWIHNSERVAGRTSFNDAAWPGWTFWRPGKLKIGQYVVRVVVDGRVFTQAFYVQKEGFNE